MPEINRYESQLKKCFSNKNTHSDFIFSGSEEILKSKTFETIENDFLKLRWSFFCHGLLGGIIGVHEF